MCSLMFVCRTYVCLMCVCLLATLDCGGLCYNEHLPCISGALENSGLVGLTPLPCTVYVLCVSA